ncbi:acyl-CoA carboxylase subunit beta [Couchioplanes azureus]|uniref:acyl-CoA carboxylase subunit beta n=1 Tax=Couchioplanes caeruleus TaxID=56438 RepID=UPI00166FD8C1|nr:carboxyl transferase domain-containing protein [Couchioplanes caeruleus]GGQ84987.1 putative propionyl-CoA carboxylase beta chain 6 [Couchioplanes caeruleus subsp. azureus]
MTAVINAGEAATDVRDPLVRIGQLLDADTETLLHRPDSLGVQTARGRIDGCDVLVYCTDGTRMGGAMGYDGCVRIAETIDLAVTERVPVIGIWHSGGARLAEGVHSMDGVGLVFAAMVRASGRVPQLSVVVGPAAGGAAYGPALTDVVIMSRAGRIFVTGPDVVRSVTGEDIDQEGLGGPVAHGKHSGVAHVVAADEAEAYERCRRLVALFAAPGSFDLSVAATGMPLEALPDNVRRAYDVRPVAKALLDDGSFEELQAKWAPNIVIGLGRLGGRTVGVVANNPLRKGGCLDSLSAEKASRFVRLCDVFAVPLVVLVDVPGYLPGVDQELGGVVRRGAKLLHAFAAAVVPRVTLYMRKSYGGAYIAMNSRSLGATRVLAWPNAEVAVMGAKAAVGVLKRRELAAAAEHDRAELEARLIAEHERIAGGVDRAMSLGLIDEIVQPAQTRWKIAEALAAVPAARGSHSNIPL